MSDTPDYWCRVPELHNISQLNRKILSIPRKVKNIFLILLHIYNLEQKILLKGFENFRLTTIQLLKNAYDIPLIGQQF